MWDDFVLNHPEGLAYHLFAWKMAIENAYAHSCTYLYAEQDGQFAGILPIAHLKFPLLVNELVSLPYCDIGGCLSQSVEAQDALLNKAISMARQSGIKNLELRGRLLESDFTQQNFTQEHTSKVRMLLSLPDSSEALWTGFKSKLRSQVRKAEKNGVVFKWGSLQNLNEIYSVFAINMHQLGSPVHSKKWLQQVILNYGDRAKIGMALFEEQVIGMGIILLGAQTVSIPWASTLRDFNRLGPNMLLYWNFLKFSSDNNFKYFDFGRSTQGEGTYKFKKQWGAEPVPLEWYTYNTDNMPQTAAASPESSLRKKVASAWTKMPLSLANTMGPLLRKYISL